MTIQPHQVSFGVVILFKTIDICPVSGK